MAKQLTMKDIARLAGVSQPTVSRVINGNSVNEELAKRVMKVVQEVGFIPNKSAQTLKQSQSKLIGISVSEMYNPYFVELIDHIETIARKKGYNIILHNAKHNPITEWDNIQNFMMRQIDGCIIVPTGSYNVDRMNKLAVPVVAITKSMEGLDSVAVDHSLAGRIVAKHFIKQGHHTFGYIGTKNDDKFIGFEHELNEHGISLNSECFIELKHGTSDHIQIQQSLKQYFNKFEQLPFSCVFAENDIIAFEFKQLAEQKGMTIPDHVSLIGFDDTYLSRLLAISSIHQPVEEMVEMAIAHIINRIEGHVGQEPFQLQLEPILMERHSSRLNLPDR